MFVQDVENNENEICQSSILNDGIQKKVGKRRRLKKKNRGSATIEMTLLIPICIGCVYFYMMFFLFFVQVSKEMNIQARQLYSAEQMGEVEGKAHGKRKSSQCEVRNKMFEIQLEMTGNQEDPFQQIRRWQMIASGI